MSWIERYKTKHGERFRVRTRKDGRKSSETTGPKEKAAVRKKDRLDERHFRFSAPSITVSQLVNEYTSHQIPVTRPKTLQAIQYSLAFLNDTLGPKEIGSIVPKDLEQVRELLFRRKFSIATVNLIFRNVTACFQYACRMGFLQVNPAEGMQIKPPLVARFLSAGESRQLLRACRIVDLVKIVQFALYTGMRKSEILDLKQKDVQGDIILVRDSKTSTPRCVPVHPFIKDDLASFDFSKWTENRLNRAYYRAVKRSGLGRVRFHDLRHTFCSNYLMAGGTLIDLQRITGIKSLSVLQRYSHFTDSYLKERIRVIPGL